MNDETLKENKRDFIDDSPLLPHPKEQDKNIVHVKQQTIFLQHKKKKTWRDKEEEKTRVISKG